jgi:RNA polymerase sigma factor (sigma-70 family)
MRTEDGKIIDKCLNGEPEAFGLLVDKYKASIFALIYSKVQNFHDAQDITQDVFLEAYRDLRKLRHWDSFVWWLYSIAYNNCKNWFRAQSKRPDSNFIEDQEQEKLETPSMNAYHENLVNESLRDTLDSLPEKYREVLTLYYLGGMDSVEIARAIGTSPTAVRQRLSRARIQLREEALVMMGETFSQQKLQVTFTFRIVEAVKRIKINPVSTMKGLPWGLSLATGLIITVMSLNPYVSWFSQIGDYARSVLPSETKVLKVGEIPVDVVKTSSISILANNMGKGKGGEPKQLDIQNALFMAPQGEGGEWIKKADMPTARYCLSTSVVNGKIYAIGGSPDALGMISTIEEYDPMTDIWIKKTDMPTARYCLATSVVNGKIYAIGGYNNGVYYAVVEEYDPGTDTWTKKTDMSTAKMYVSTSVVDGKIYAIGGNDRNNIFSIVEEYDPVTDKWIKKANMPTARYGLSVSVASGKIYAIGGEGWACCLSIVEEYDPVTDTWAKKADMSIARSGLSTSTVNGKIYAIGGRAGEDCLSIVEEYDPVIDIWTKKTDMPTARYGISTSIMNGKIYVIGGATANWNPIYSTVEEYTPEGWPFAISSNGKLPSKWGQHKSE